MSEILDENKIKESLEALDGWVIKNNKRVGITGGGLI